MRRRLARREGLDLMKRVTFYYVRHGRTEFNRDGIIQGGRVDSPLVEESVPTVRESAKVLADVDFARCFVSPLGRAQQTADLLLEGRDVEKHTLEGLKEFDFGSIDGKPYKGNRLAFARCFLRQDFSSVGGESGAQVRERVRRAFKKMYKESSDGDNVLVVGHGAYVRYVVQEFAKMTAFSRRITSTTMRVPNAGIALVVAVDGDFELTCMPVKAERFQRIVSNNTL